MSPFEREGGLTDKEEIGLALVLLQSLKMTDSMPLVTRQPNDATEEAYRKCIQLATDLGVKDEYFQMLFLMPVMKIKIEDLDRPPRKDKPTHKKRKNESPTT